MLTVEVRKTFPVGGKPTVLRLMFTERDLARTRVATSSNPLWEILLSLHQLQRQDHAIGPFARWRALTIERLRESGLWEGLRTLSGLSGQQSTLAELLDPRLQETRIEDSVSAWEGIRASTRGGTLRESLNGYFRLALESHWATICDQLAADRGQRTSAMVNGGVEGLLTSFQPNARWKAPVLEVDRPCQRDVTLTGQGLLLVPSFFHRQVSLFQYGPDTPSVLVYPVSTGWDWVRTTALDEPDKHLAALLGRTRAAVLRAIADGGSTGELAKRLGISVATASEHAGVLREAGLVVSNRHGKRVLHSLTELGGRILPAGRISLPLPASSLAG
ncbi:ArsR family transcriptional regulator [Pseudonocardiaceae bacterium YIM PH 21723]|nr:ArsR family transcriptional regulator [Pseudonocardiaceae bacterium YIM PH 21723]